MTLAALPRDQHELRSFISRSGDAVVVDGIRDSDDNEELLTVARALGAVTTLGQSISTNPLDAHGVYRVEPLNDGVGVRDEQDYLIFSTTAQRFDCHTDGYQSPHHPQYVLLLCVRVDRAGGETFLAHIDDIKAELAEADLCHLREARFPSFRGRGAVLFGDPDRERLRFNSREIERSGMTMNAETGAVVARMQAAADRVCQRTRFRLMPGQCLVVDNERLLHGRAALMRDSRRLLKRVWVTTRREDVSQT